MASIISRVVIGALDSASTRAAAFRALSFFSGAFGFLVDLAGASSTTLHDLPAPGDDQHPIRWTHVGEITHVAAQLAGVVEFLERP